MSAKRRRMMRIVHLLSTVERPKDVARLQKEVFDPMGFVGLSRLEIERLWERYSDEVFAASWYSLPPSLDLFIEWLREPVEVLRPSRAEEGSRQP